MIDHSAITKAIEQILTDGVSNYVIERTELRNDDPNLAAQGSGWIGIRKGSIKMALRAMPNRWAYEVETLVEVQCANYQDKEAAEEQMEAALAEVMGVLLVDLTLGGSVGMVNEFSISEPEAYEGAEAYYYARIITIRAEATV